MSKCLWPIIICFLGLAFACATQGDKSQSSSAAETPAPSAVPAKTASPEPTPSPTPVPTPKPTVYLKAEERILMSDGTLINSSRFTYDNGLLKKEERFNSNSSLTSQKTWDYQDESNPTWILVDSRGNTSNKGHQKRDVANHVLLDEVTDVQGNLLSQSAYAYDGQGFKTGWEIRDSRGVVQARSQYTYRDGKIVETKVLDASDQVVAVIKAEWSSLGLQTKEETRDRSGNLTQVFTWKYDGQNLLVEKNEFDGSGHVLRTMKYQRDKDSQISRIETFDASGRLIEIAIYSYIPFNPNDR